MIVNSYNVLWSGLPMADYLAPMTAWRQLQELINYTNSITDWAHLIYAAIQWSLIAYCFLFVLRTVHKRALFLYSLFVCVFAQKQKLRTCHITRSRSLAANLTNITYIPTGQFNFFYLISDLIIRSHACIH